MPNHTPSEDTPTRERRVRSYVLRAGRMGSGQQRALLELAPRYALPFVTQPLDAEAAFARCAPLILEIGFGMGDTTAQIAAASPELDFLGIEVHPPGIGALLQQIEARRLTNVRIVQHDAVEVLHHMLAPGVLAGAAVFFPDPWPKKRHHKRRFLQPANVDAMARTLVPQGWLHVATDHDDYWTVIEPLLDTHGAFVRQPDFGGPQFPLPLDGPLTNFEAKYEVEGRRRHRGSWRRG
jgi:tRNA (guanine-N7-)-methyltransferase